MDDLFKDLVLLGGTPKGIMKQQLFQVLSICQIKTESQRIKQFKYSSESTEFYTMEQFKYSSKPHIVSHNEAV